MKRVVLVLFALFTATVNAQQVNTTAQVNQLLKSKNQVGYQRIYYLPTPFLGRVDRHVRNYSGHAEATSTEIVEASDLAFEEPKLTKLPEIALLTQKSLRNCGDATLSSSISLSVSGTKSWSVTKTRSVSTTNTKSLSGSLTIPKVGSLSGSMSWQKTVAAGTSNVEGTQETISRSMTDSISIGPRKAILVSLVAYQNTLAVPFHATVTVDGPLRANTSGKARISDILSKEERTFPIEGTLTISDVSEAAVRTDNLPKDQGCLETDKTLTEGNVAQFNAYTDDLANELEPSEIKKTLKGSGFNFKSLSNALVLLSNDGDTDGPTIGAANGTSYQILYTEERAVPTPACGFNDIGAMNTGIFTIEHREYTTHLDGKEIARWHEEVEIFKECYLP